MGIYSSAGTMTCAKRFGSLGYEGVDAHTWKDWGIDYVSTYFTRPRLDTPLFSATKYVPSLTIHTFSPQFNA